MKTSILQIMSDPALGRLALHPPAFNAIVENMLRDIPANMLSGLFSPMGRARDDRPEEVSLAHGVQGDLIEADPELGAAVVTIKGIITPYADEYRWSGYDAADPRGIAATLRSLASQVGTIFLYIDSPGGHALWLVELAEVMAEIRAGGTKLIAFSDVLCASAAYWIAAGCHEIYASPTAQIGSIGVYLAFYSFEELIGKMGIKLHLFRDGMFKGMGLFGKPVTDEEKELLELGVAECSAEFKGYVRGRRGKVVEAAMQGQCLDGRDCIEAKLVDGTFPSLAELVSSKLAA